MHILNHLLIPNVHGEQLPVVHAMHLFRVEEAFVIFESRPGHATRRARSVRHFENGNSYGFSCARQCRHLFIQEIRPNQSIQVCVHPRRMCICIKKANGQHLCAIHVMFALHLFNPGYFLNFSKCYYK